MSYLVLLIGMVSGVGDLGDLDLTAILLPLVSLFAKVVSHFIHGFDSNIISGDEQQHCFCFSPQLGSERRSLPPACIKSGS